MKTYTESINREAGRTYIEDYLEFKAKMEAYGFSEEEIVETEIEEEAAYAVYGDGYLLACWFINSKEYREF